MDDIKNSDILEKLIAYAKSYGGKDSALTAERYLLSVIDFVSETFRLIQMTATGQSFLMH